jgi:hypothetical protein
LAFGLFSISLCTCYELAQKHMSTPRKRILTATIAVLLLLQTAAPVLACPVCFSSNKKSRTAFLLTTGLLSAMPWVIIGGGVFWYKRRLRGLDEESGDVESLPDQDSHSE